MGFSGHGLGWLMVVLLCAGVAVARDGPSSDSPEITVMVNNSVQMPVFVLRHAESEASRIFAVSGIQIRWLDCAPDLGREDPCHRVPGQNEFEVHVVRTGQTSLDSIFGNAFMGQDGDGKYCDIFFDPIQETARTTRTGLSPLIATVIAHELGHLLLGSHSHSFFGIMMPHWSQDELQRIAMGSLLFSSEEAVRMRMRLQNRKAKSIKSTRDSGLQRWSYLVGRNSKAALIRYSVQRLRTSCSFGSGLNTIPVSSTATLCKTLGSSVSNQRM